MFRKAIEIDAIGSAAQSFIIIRGGVALLGIKHSSLRHCQTKLIDLLDSEKQYEKATENVLFVLNTLTYTSKGKRSLLILKVSLITITQSAIKRAAAFNCSRCVKKSCINLRPIFSPISLSISTSKRIL
jgi:hypothetical protein